MGTPPDIEARILRFYHAEKWTIGTIARQLHIHHSVVRRVLAQAGLPPPRPSRSATKEGSSVRPIGLPVLNLLTATAFA
jgi:hypothetical protein